jgi:multidrug efflux pump subunit AcrA (membrane-fusion protein)
LAQSELVIAQENRQQGKLEYQQQMSLLNLRSIRSPIDGVVVDQMLNAGEMADPMGTKKSILKLAQLDPLRVKVILPSSLFGTIKPSTSVDVVPESGNSVKGYKATVHNVDKLIDSASGTFAVYLDLPNKNLAIAAGARCKASFPTSTALPAR